MMKKNDKASSEIIRISFSELEEVFYNILIKYGFTPDKAKTCARIFAESSRDGVYSHGVDRFPLFIQYIKDGYISVNAVPEKISSVGVMEQWNGNLGPGPLSALYCTNRTMELAKKYGMGCIALSNTNHWMRGGTYGWHAAKAGFVFIGWTNTIRNMSAWGAIDSRLGNNPIVLGIPYQEEAIVLDMALSQFSYGKLNEYRLKERNLPVPGGYNKKGYLTNDPREILDSERALPIGYWKGAGLSLLLDLIATILSGGLSTHKISQRDAEYGISQVFIAFDITKLKNYQTVDQVVNEVINDYKASNPESELSEILYPGERVLRTRKENMEKGIPVQKSILEKIISL
jgi:3-dehydro-L-gulonate 2-dehydrogenase